MRRKVVFGNFRYRECDNLALYLEKMAREGWIFRDWRLGMVFEKEEPQKLEYAVEVFSEGNENDTKPEPETEEFAVYCREAGWELVSSRKKLCIFRKLSQDAAPIMEPEERYRNIKKAERESGGRWAIFICRDGNVLIEEDKKGIMGRAVTYEITPADSSLLPEESVTCELYETPHAWLLDRMEELWSKEAGKEMLIRDPGRMLRISGMDQLEADQILFIREALKL